ncbi:hypothetical protein GQ457_04G038540 [Hibiscus cannabinus]
MNDFEYTLVLTISMLLNLLRTCQIHTGESVIGIPKQRKQQIGEVAPPYTHYQRILSRLSSLPVCRNLVL